MPARAESTLSIKLYDGSDDGKKVYDTLAVIGRRIEPGAGNIEEPARQDGLARLARWPMTISYFLVGSGDQTPVVHDLVRALRERSEPRR